MVRIFGILAIIQTGRLFKVHPKEPGEKMQTEFIRLRKEDPWQHCMNTVMCFRFSCIIGDFSKLFVHLLASQDERRYTAWAVPAAYYA
jgi:hypothetical protein